MFASSSFTSQAPERSGILNIGGTVNAVFGVVVAFLRDDANRFVDPPVGLFLFDVSLADAAHVPDVHAAGIADRQRLSPGSEAASFLGHTHPFRPYPTPLPS